MARKRASEQTPPLGRDAIVQAALQVLDRDGFSNLTLRRVADELGVQAPALYWHVKDKTELIDHMAEAMLQTEFNMLEARKGDEHWQDWLMATMGRLRKVMHSRRDGGRVVTGAHLSPAFTLVKLFELSFESLTSDGVSLRRADIIVATVIHFVFGRVIEEQSGPTPEQRNLINLNELFSDYPLFLETVKLTKNSSYSDEFTMSLRFIIAGATAIEDSEG
jgi:TetR/AcrR family transcriptional regulator, tetracycline repressor protein